MYNEFVDVTPEKLNHLVDTIEGCWQQFASVLAPNLFKGKFAAIKQDYPTSALQAKAMLEIGVTNLVLNPSDIYLLMHYNSTKTIYKILGRKCVWSRSCEKNVERYKNKWQNRLTS